MVGAKKAFDGWNQLDRGFDSEREGRFLRDLLAALEAQDADEYIQFSMVKGCADLNL